MSPLAKFALICILSLSSSMQSAYASSDNKKDVAAIREAVEVFRTSIIKKDKASFVSLFYSDNPDHMAWQFVDDDIRVARFSKFAPEARKALRVPDSNYLTFIEGIAGADEKSEEIFKNVVIDTDGEIASVNFDYSFLMNGEEMNWGREMWHMVRTEEGWKIISVIFSQRDPASK